jgi:hypothetical protein
MRAFEAFPIQHAHVAVFVVDQAGILQLLDDDADGRTLRAEHHRQELVAQLEVVFVDAFVAGGGRTTEWRLAIRMLQTQEARVEKTLAW